MTAAQAPAVLAEDVRVRLGRADVLGGVDLQVAAGSITALLGPSGCGKTTLLRAVAGFHPADSGRIALAGRVVQDPHTLVSAADRAIGYVAQEGALFPHLCVADNIAFGLRRAGLHRRRATHARHVADLLDLVGLSAELAGRLPRELSGGQQQRVALARALAPQPAVVLLDEPFASLDADLRRTTGRATVDALRRSGAAAVLVTHDQAEALSLVDQVAVMRGGVITQVGSPEEIYRSPADAATGRQLGNGIVLRAAAGGGVAQCVLGQVALASSATGDVEILVRPEQVALGDAGDDGVAATVVAEHFFGHDCLVDLELAGGARLSARVGPDARPAVGAPVRLHVRGTVAAYPPGVIPPEA